MSDCEAIILEEVEQSRHCTGEKKFREHIIRTRERKGKSEEPQVGGQVKEEHLLGSKSENKGRGER